MGQCSCHKTGMGSSSSQNKKAAILRDLLQNTDLKLFFNFVEAINRRSIQFRISERHLADLLIQLYYFVVVRASAALISVIH